MSFPQQYNFHTHSNSNSVLIRLKTSTSKYSIGMSCILCTKIHHPYCTMLKHIHMYTHTRVEQVVGSEKRHIKAYNLATKAPSHYFSLMSKFSAKNSFAEGGVSRTFGQDWRHFVLVNSKLVKMIQNGTYLLVNLGRNKVRDRTMVRRRTIPKTTPKIRKSYPIWWKKNWSTLTPTHSKMNFNGKSIIKNQHHDIYSWDTFNAWYGYSDTLDDIPNCNTLSLTKVYDWFVRSFALNRGNRPD